MTKPPTRTDAYTQCGCGGTMSIQLVEPIPDKPMVMRYTYQCLSCGTSERFEIAKKTVTGL